MLLVPGFLCYLCHTSGKDASNLRNPGMRLTYGILQSRPGHQSLKLRHVYISWPRAVRDLQFGVQKAGLLPTTFQSYYRMRTYKPHQGALLEWGPSKSLTANNFLSNPCRELLHNMTSHLFGFLKILSLNSCFQIIMLVQQCRSQHWIRNFEKRKSKWKPNFIFSNIS